MVTRITGAGKVSSACSSCSMAGRSRWLVGRRAPAGWVAGHQQRERGAVRSRATGLLSAARRGHRRGRTCQQASGRRAWPPEASTGSAPAPRRAADDDLRSRRPSHRHRAAPPVAGTVRPTTRSISVICRHPAPTSAIRSPYPRGGRSVRGGSRRVHDCPDQPSDNNAAARVGSPAGAATAPAAAHLLQPPDLALGGSRFAGDCSVWLTLWRGCFVRLSSLLLALATPCWAHSCRVWAGLSSCAWRRNFPSAPTRGGGLLALGR